MSRVSIVIFIFFVAITCSTARAESNSGFASVEKDLQEIVSAVQELSSDTSGEPRALMDISKNAPYKRLADRVRQVILDLSSWQDLVDDSQLDQAYEMASRCQETLAKLRTDAQARVH
jgi:L-fucose isomerase-like protein